jgi:hypothetical protein
MVMIRSSDELTNAFLASGAHAHIRGRPGSIRIGESEMLVRNAGTGRAFEFRVADTWIMEHAWSTAVQSSRSPIKVANASSEADSALGGSSAY